jgi:hypothetical protein
MNAGRAAINSKAKTVDPNDDRSLEMNIQTTPDGIDYQLTRAFVAIELQSQDRIDQAVDRLAIRLLIEA